MAEVEAAVAARQHNLQFVDLDQITVDTTVAAVLPAALARRHHVVPIGRRFGAPVVAMADPTDVMAVDTLRATLGREFIAVVADPGQIDRCLDEVYASSPPVAVDQSPDRVRLPEAPETPAEESAGLENLLVGYGGGTKSGSGTSLADLLPNIPTPAAGPRMPAHARLASPPPPPEPEVVSGPPTGRDAGDVVVAMASAAEAASAGAVEAVGHDPDDERVLVQLDDYGLDRYGLDAFGAGRAVAEAGTDSTAPEPVPEPEPPVLQEPAFEMGGTPEPELQWHDPQEPELLEPELGLPETDGPPPAAAAAVAHRDDELDQAADAASSEPIGSDPAIAHWPPLARVLVEGGRVSVEDMASVLEERDRSGNAITRILTARGLVSEADLMWAMAEEMGLEFVDLDVRAVDFASAYALPESTARHHNVLLVGYEEGGTPVVAASNPTDVFAMDDLRTILGRNFVTVVATRSQITTYIDKAYNQGGDASEVANTAASDFDEIDEGDLNNLQIVDDAPIVRYVNLLVLQALNERASDIHVEPTADNLRIRYRIDGVLHDVSTAPKNIAAAVTTRLKVMADINIAEHRIPQDGRISLTVGSRPIDLRMATLPTIYGEKVVMRVLDKSNVVLGFEDLGFDADLLDAYRQVFTKPYGTILVTGPTGSGKTTTLYATLAALNAPDRNIITVEDPVELRIKGINQVQLNVKAGLTFASALRSILRADPDILLVGEIRDKETALISVEAALTGHLVLATLHTNDSASTPMRLVEMGLEPYLVTSALSAAVAQRLSRRLCVHCREPFDATEADIASAGWRPEEVYALSEKPVLYRATGCSACSKTGYRGRKALLELLVVTEEIERLIIEGGTADDIHRMAVEQGMVTLRQSGLRKALEGETTLEEVLRVVA